MIYSMYRLFMKVGSLSLQPRSMTSPASRVMVEKVYSWASKLSAEARGPLAALDFYVWPDSIRPITFGLDEDEGRLIALVGLQGVGKSSALLALKRFEQIPLEMSDVALFKWRREKDLFESLLGQDHELSQEFLEKYTEDLMQRFPVVREQVSAMGMYSKTNIVSTVERWIGKNRSNELRKEVWLDMLRGKKVILIDTPDYSRTDKRVMVRDLNDIHWLWVTLSNKPKCKPNIVLAVQKEMFGGHFFFDKMQVVELEPLEPAKMLEAYSKHFGTVEPFDEEALLMLARMSRGVFRRFLRYICLALDHLRTRLPPCPLVDSAVVKRAVTIECLTEDMEFEFAEFFPRQSDAPAQAIRLLMELEENGSLKQSELADRLGIEDYRISRLLSRLEQRRYVKRERSGTDKIVAIAGT